MRTLPRITPTPEQLPFIQDAKPGVVVIRGAAGSGKTTTALLRLRQLASFWLSRRERQGLVDPVRVLVLTYNRTLRGYIEELANQQVIGRANLQMQIDTFSRWALDQLPYRAMLDADVRKAKLLSLAKAIPLPGEFMLSELDYLIGRFLPDNLPDYLTLKREGRGLSPRVDRPIRERLLNEVVLPYSEWKLTRRVHDWNDLAIELDGINEPNGYDVIVADEVQDFSANQIRAIIHFANNPSSVTFVLDSAQRIYPAGFTWAEAGVTVHPSNSFRLQKNYRNTAEICRFALPLLDGLDIGNDGTFPNFSTCQSQGPLPIVLRGKYQKQVAYVLQYIAANVDLTSESVAFLKPKGGGWFTYLESQLKANSYSYVTLTRQQNWPAGSENIALSTMHSAKGLEFDHVFILGLSNEVTAPGDDPQDDQLESDRRLLAMAITRARKSVIVGFKPGEASHLTTYFVDGTYAGVAL
jgi:superfamily I DNA/RNA helicase